MQMIKDPRTIQQSEFPFHFVLSNQTTSLIAFLINWKTRANYDHCMQAINAGKFITQDFGGYHEIPMDSYLIKGGQLKFVKLINANAHFNTAFQISILNRLSQPWYKKIYDYGNILGRAIGLSWLHLPGTYDCSEIALAIVRENTRYLPNSTVDIIMGINKNATPDDIDQVIKNNPSEFDVTYQWQADEGITV